MIKTILYVLKYQAKKLDLSCMCFILCVYWSEMLCAHMYMFPPNRAGMCDACMNPDVVFTVFKIVFCVMFIMLWIKFI